MREIDVEDVGEPMDGIRTVGRSESFKADDMLTYGNNNFNHFTSFNNLSTKATPMSQIFKSAKKL